MKKFLISGYHHDLIMNMIYDHIILIANVENVMHQKLNFKNYLNLKFLIKYRHLYIEIVNFASD